MALILTGVALILVCVVAAAPAVTANPSGKVLAFVALFLLPATAGFFGVSQHMERSKETSFCLSCHVMEPYGRSLYRDDKSFIPAAHFQNARIPRNEACYTCHTNYTIFGTNTTSRHPPIPSSSMSRSTIASACTVTRARGASRKACTPP